MLSFREWGMNSFTESKIEQIALELLRDELTIRDTLLPKLINGEIER